jgi:hypothetical protein
MALKSISIYGPQVGDIVKVRDEHEAECGIHMGLVIRLLKWPDEAQHLIDCVIFQDPNLVNPIQLQTPYIEVVSKA